MARSSECLEQYAQKVFDSAGIVREAIFRQLPTPVQLRQQSRDEDNQEHDQRHFE
jgi:hypothetical protein